MSPRPECALLALLLLASACGGCHGRVSASGDGAPPAMPADASLPPPPQPSRLPLSAGWTLQSSAKVAGAGADISQPGYTTRGWYPATVPTTVLAALVAHGVYPDPYALDNLRTIPSEPFKVSWWYRVEFTLPSDYAGQAAWLDLEGINYRANVWLNGHLIAGADTVAGTFTAYEWDVTETAHAGAVNALAIEVFPPDPEGDLALTWLDWNAAPPDRDMGIWQDVYMARSGSLAVRGTRVSSTVDPSLESAQLTVRADITNTTGKDVHGQVRLVIEQLELVEDIDLAAHETRTITFSPAQHAGLELANPRLWWPAQLGSPELYDLSLVAEVDGKLSDVENVRFGVREVTFDLDDKGHRVFRVNGKRILVRGGGWASDMMLRPATPARLLAELRYVLDLGLNTIRLEGKLETDEFYAATDALGIMTMPGWMCCDRWESWEDWNAVDHRIAQASLDAQSRRMRNHPSVITFLIGSDKVPPPDVELEYLGVLERGDWPNPVMSSASGDTSPSLGPSGVKMNGPYDWIAPSYWYLDKDRGGAFGFNTETGPGPSVPEIETLRGMLTPASLDKLWSDPGAKQLHAGTEGSPFDNLGLFSAALKARHGAPANLEDWVKKAQLMNYEGERAQFEAYGRYKYAPATGVIHWLLNNAWPSLIWHLYGYDLLPAAAYFGAKMANQPLHIQYSYDDQAIVVVNHTPRAESGLAASVRVYNLDSSVKFSKDVNNVSVGEDGVVSLLTLPAISGLSGTYFVALRLTRAGALVSSNFYWLSKKAEIIDWEHSTFFHTATAQFADYTALADLPAASVKTTATFEKQAGGVGVVHATVENTGSTIAFFVRLKVTRGKDGDPVAPILWDDNYVSLLPGEKRQIDASYQVSDMRGWAPFLHVSGWNVPAQLLGR